LGKKEEFALGSKRLKRPTGRFARNKETYQVCGAKTVRKISITVVAVVVVIAGLAGILWVISEAPRHTEAELAASVAQEIIRQNLEQATQGYPSPDGTVIAVISPQDAKLEPYHWFDAPYHTIWKYQNGRLETAIFGDVEAIKSERNAPLFLIIVRQMEKDTARVDIAVQYAKSSTVGFSDGGYASHWQLKFSGEKWMLTERDDYIFWD